MVPSLVAAGRTVFKRLWASRAVLLLALIIVGFFWKLTLTDQYTFLESPDNANQVLPWLQVDVKALRHWAVPLWDPYEWAGQSLVGQVQPAVLSPFTWLLALAPVHGGQLQVYWVNRWFVLIHIAAAIFAFLLFRDLKLSDRSSIIGGALYATVGFVGGTGWPQMLAAAIWAPLIFLFLFRAARGQKPWASSCLAGLFLGFSWLSGHHGPAVHLSLACIVAFLVILWRGPAPLRYKAGLAACFLGLTGLIGAVQVLPAAEYGQRALRWTLTGVLHWNDKVGFPEHVEYGLKSIDLLHIVLPGSDRAFDPFVGIVALSLAVIAVGALARRAEVRVFTVIAIVAFLFSMPKGVVWYGPLYALVPLVEKVRTPAMAMSIFQFGLVGLAAFGCEELLSRPAQPMVRGVMRGAAMFGAALLFLMLLADFLRPTVNSAYLGENRPGMIAIAALLFSGTCLALRRRTIGPSAAAVAVCLIALIEQGNVAGYDLVNKADQNRATYLKPMTDTQDIAAWLRAHQPGRADINTKDIAFNFGNWFGVDALQAYDASMPERTMTLGWWQDRCVRLLGLKYTVSRATTRPGQREVFAGISGIRIFENPDVLPRVWTVHQIRGAINDNSAALLVQNGSFDLATDAVMTGPQPRLETCTQPDHIGAAKFELQRVGIDAEMGCRGMVMVSDSWFPGWVATVDGRLTTIQRVDVNLRGIVVERGRHRIEMRYMPLSVIAGFLMFLIGVGATVFVARRGSNVGPNLLVGITVPNDNLPVSVQSAPVQMHTDTRRQTATSL